MTSYTDKELKAEAARAIKGADPKARYTGYDLRLSPYGSTGAVTVSLVAYGYRPDLFGKPGVTVNIAI